MNLVRFYPPCFKDLIPDQELGIYEEFNKSLLNDYPSCQQFSVNMSLQGVCW